MTPLRVLVFSSLYPSASQPRHGIFVETRLNHLLRDCAVDARVIAPVPWFPLRSGVFGRYARYAATPRQESRAGIAVRHPRYPMLPRIGVPLQPASMAYSAWRDVQRLLATGWSPQLIDAHYFYPDGVAAALIARRLKVPLVITARGSDVNLLACTPYIGRRVLWAADQAAAVVAVSSQLRSALLDLGVGHSKVSVLRNGVDLERFRPIERFAARVWLGLPQRPTLLCVGNLVAEKGFELAIESLRNLSGVQLLVVGEGPQRAQLHAVASGAGVADRVVFRPSMQQQDLYKVYSAADALLLTSTREGWPNVVLEAMASGTPVVALDVGAVREMIDAPELGRVLSGRDPEALADAARPFIEAPPSRERLRQHAGQFDWRSISIAQFLLFRQCLGDAATDAPLVEVGARDAAAERG